MKLKIILGVICVLVLAAFIPSQQTYNTIYVKLLRVTGTGIQMEGNKIDLDADRDTSITVDTDDQIDFEVSGSDVASITSSGWVAASGFDLNGNTMTIDADADTTMVASADDQITMTIGAGTGHLQVTTGNLRVGNGSEDTTLNGEDAYVEGTLEVDGAVNFDGAVDIDGSLTSATGALSVTDNVLVTEVAAGADSGVTNEYTEIALTSPVDTTGTNTHNMLTLDAVIGNSTAGTNTVTALQIDGITDDPQVVEKAINIGDEWDYAIDTGLPIVDTSMHWFDDFIGDAALTPYTELNGADAQAAQTIVEEQYGVYQITSGDVGDGEVNDGEGLFLSLEWQADQGALVFETRLHLDTDILTTDLCAGFTDDVSTAEIAFSVGGSDAVTSTASDAVMFCYDTGADTDEWFALGVAGDTDATGNGATGTAPTADTYQTLRIEVDDGGADCRFYIDGALVGTLTANCVTATTLVAPGVVISSDGAADSNVVDIDYIYVGAARD